MYPTFLSVKGKKGAIEWILKEMVKGISNRIHFPTAEHEYNFLLKMFLKTLGEEQGLKDI